MTELSNEQTIITTRSDTPSPAPTDAPNAHTDGAVLNPPIAVCMKWVALRPDIDPVSGAVSSDERWSGPSLADQAALECALQIGAARNTTVIVLSIGDTPSDTMLTDALACGATSAIRIATPTSGNDTAPTSASVAAALAEVLRPLAPQLVFCGDWSLDRGSGSVPPFLAAELNYGQACGIVHVQRQSGDTLLVDRRLDGGRRESLAINGPAVISVEGAAAHLRRATLTGLMAAQKTPIEIRHTTTLVASIPPVRTGPFRPRARILDAPSSTEPRRRLEVLTGAFTNRTPPVRATLDPEDAADLILAKLADWGYDFPSA
jgi:electron transfer flavoprotein beta subunit